MSSDGYLDTPADLAFVGEVQLCETFHCLPDELDRQDEVRIVQLSLYLQGKTMAGNRQAAHAAQQKNLSQRGQ